MEIIIFFIIVALVSYVIASFRTKSKPKANITTKEFNEEVSQRTTHEQSWNDKYKRFYHKGVQRVSIAGLSYRDIGIGDIGYFEGSLIKEPDNKYDKNAIAIYSGSKKVGYIPKSDNREIANSTDIDCLSIFGYIEPEYDNYNNKQYYTGEIFIPITATADQVERYKERLKSLV